MRLLASYEAYRALKLSDFAEATGNPRYQCLGFYYGYSLPSCQSVRALPKIAQNGT